MIRSSITSCGTGRTPPAQLLWGILLAPVTGPRNTGFYSVWNFVIGGRYRHAFARAAGRRAVQCGRRDAVGDGLGELALAAGPIKFLRATSWRYEVWADTWVWRRAAQLALLSQSRIDRSCP